MRAHSLPPPPIAYALCARVHARAWVRTRARVCDESVRIITWRAHVRAWACPAQVDRLDSLVRQSKDESKCAPPPPFPTHPSTPPPPSPNDRFLPMLPPLPSTNALSLRPAAAAAAPPLPCRPCRRRAQHQKSLQALLDRAHAEYLLAVAQMEVPCPPAHPCPTSLTHPPHPPTPRACPDRAPWPGPRWRDRPGQHSTGARTGHGRPVSGWPGRVR